MLNIIEGGVDRVLRRVGKVFQPSVDVLESDAEVLVLVEVPGCKLEDIDVWVEDDVLNIEAEREKFFKGYIEISGRRPESYDYSIPLPSNVMGGGVEKQIDNGLLEVRMRKANLDDDEVVIDKENKGMRDNGETGSGDGTGVEFDVSSIEDLHEMDYRDLQQIAVSLDVKGNLPKDEMIEEVAEKLDL